LSDNPSDEQRWIPSNEELPGGKVTPPSGIPGTDVGQTDWGAPEAPQGPAGAGQPGFSPQGQNEQPSGMAVASLVCGILGFVFCPLIGSILALIFGYIARSEIDKSGGRIGNRGLAIAGIVLGWVGLVIIGLFILLLVILAISSPDSFNEGSSSVLRPSFS
jgi:hypothetical protein